MITLKFSKFSSGGSRIFQTVRQPQRGANLLFSNFFSKLHENEKNGQRRAAHPSVPLEGSATDLRNNFFN